MEQVTNTSTNTSPGNKYSDITEKEFKEHLLFGKNKSCFDLEYFILNTLYHISNSVTGTVIVKVLTKANAKCVRYLLFFLILVWTSKITFSITIFFFSITLNFPRNFSS